MDPIRATAESRAEEFASKRASTNLPNRWTQLGPRWGKRAGVAMFLFFLVKGLAWVVVPVALATWWAK